MQTKLPDLVSLYSKLSSRYDRALVDQFIDQLVFCFFMGEMYLFPTDKGLKQTILGYGRNPNDLSTGLDEIFSNVDSHRKRIDPHVELAVPLNINLTLPEVILIRSLAMKDWAKVTPFLFGRLFELSLDPIYRAKLGAHYTPETDIRDLLEPVVFHDLLISWGGIKDSIQGGKITGAEARNTLERFIEKLRSIKVLDPACGTGNFLVVFLNCLLAIEKEAMDLSDKVGFFWPIPFDNIQQCLGIEKDPRACKLARLALWVSYFQWVSSNVPNLLNVLDPFNLPERDNVRNEDAILDLSDPMQPREQQWPEAGFIVGNPPYLGASKMRQLFGDDYCTTLSWVFEDRVQACSDFGSYWFEKARDLIDRGKTKAAGFVISTAIKQEWSRAVLDRVNQSGKIFFAISDRVWEGGEAAVHVSLIGFTGPEYNGPVLLDGKEVREIYSNLSSHHDISSIRQFKNNEVGCTSGSGDVLENSMEEDEALKILKKSATFECDHIRPFRGGRDLVQGSSNRWTLYSESEINSSVHVHHGRYLVTPRVSKHCVFLWLDSVIVPDSGIVVFDTDDDLIFGILQSRIHEVWTLANCGWRGETRNYQIKSCFRSFPFPSVTKEMGDEIREAAQKLEDFRSKWLFPPELIKEETVSFVASPDGPWKRYSSGETSTGKAIIEYPLIRPLNKVAESILARKTVTALYNLMPTLLSELKNQLDDAVFRSYGCDTSLDDRSILEWLRDMNQLKVSGITT